MTSRGQGSTVVGSASLNDVKQSRSTSSSTRSARSSTSRTASPGAGEENASAARSTVDTLTSRCERPRVSTYVSPVKEPRGRVRAMSRASPTTPASMAAKIWS